MLGGGTRRTRRRDRRKGGGRGRASGGGGGARVDLEREAAGEDFRGEVRLEEGEVERTKSFGEE